MKIEFHMTPEQQAADDARALAFQRQRVATLTPAEYAAERAALAARKPPAAATPGKHASTLTDAEYAAERRRLTRPWRSA